MAGRRVFGGSELASALQREGVSAEAIEALVARPGAPNGFHGSRSVLNFTDIRQGMPDHPFFHQTDLDDAAAADDDSDECLHQPEKKRRLSAKQVEWLERSFEIENKLEPQRKIQLARDVGLQPRQVAIWFQNRRARWKTKQLEKDYEELKLQYDSLRADYDSLLREKEKLKTEVVVLTDRLLLLEENGSGGKSSPFELNIQRESQSSQLPANYLDSTSDERKPELPAPACKQEEVCSANSAALDSDQSSLYAAEPVDYSSNMLEWDHSDVSLSPRAGNYDGGKARRFPKLEDGSSCNYGGLQVEEEEQAAFWYWPY